MAPTIYKISKITLKQSVESTVHNLLSNYGPLEKPCSLLQFLPKLLDNNR